MSGWNRLRKMIVFVFLIYPALQERASAVDGTPNWLQSQVSGPIGGASISSPVLAFDHHGTPSVAWSSVLGVGSNTIHRSEFSGLGIWADQLIVSGSGLGLQTALSFDRAERPTVSWVDLIGAVEAQFNNGAVQSVATTGANFLQPALSLTHDLAGNLHGIYSGATPGNLFNISKSGSTFSSTSIGTLSDINTLFDTRLTADFSGRQQAVVRAEFNSSSLQGVILLSEPSFGGDWPSAVLTTADAVNGVDIATDPTDGRVALAYTTFDSASNTSTLKYAKFSGSALVTTTVLSSTSSMFQDVSLAFDRSDGLPAIAYEEQAISPASQQLSFAFQDATLQWQSSLVDDTISINNPLGALRRPSLAFDDFGTSFPAIAYVDSDESLVVAFDPPAVPEPCSLSLLSMAVAVILLPRRRPRKRRSFRA